MTLATILGTMLWAAAAVAPTNSPLRLAELPTQVLAPNECALVLWERATGRRIAMLTVRPAAIRVASEGNVSILPKTSTDGEVVVGFPARAEYADDKLRIVTSLVIIANDVAGSAIVREGIISVTGPDGVEVVAPVAGIAGCSR